MFLVNDAFDRDGGGFAAADAERGDATLQIVRLERAEQRHDQPRAGGADRMTERTGAAVDVQLLPGNAEIALRGHRHHRKRFIDFEQVDVADAPADLVEQLANGRNRRGGEPLRLLAVVRVTPDLGTRRQPVALTEPPPRHDHPPTAPSLAVSTSRRNL